MSLVAASNSCSQHEVPKITVLYDNRCADPALQEGFGFSCLIEWNHHKILFDTGGKDKAFFANLQHLKIPLNQITHVFFSHHHWDHTAAIDQVLKQIPQTTIVYLPDPFSTALEKKIPFQIKTKKIKKFEKVDDGIYSLVLKGGYMFTSIYEQAILLKTSKGVVVITGCAHPGIINIIQAAKKALGEVYLVLGGFHLHHSWSSTSAKVVRQFQDLQVKKVAPCHCAGDTAIHQFEQAYGENCLRIGTGTVIKA